MTNYKGPLEIYHNNTWATAVCYQAFTNADIDVICRQLGHHNGGKAYYDTTPKPYVKWLVRNVKCNGHESRLIDCNFIVSNVSNYPFCQQASIQCHEGLFTGNKYK